MDKLEIINNALIKCGLPLAAALNDCDWNASYFYDPVRKKLLRNFAWGFAQKFEPLTAASAPKCGFVKSYTLPADFIKLISVHTQNDIRSPKARIVKVVGKQIHANVTPAYLRYICDHATEEEWPADFCDLMAAALALEIAPLATQTMGLVPLLTNLYAKALAEAQANDGYENFERVPLDFNILAARGGMGEHRDR